MNTNVKDVIRQAKEIYQNCADEFSKTIYMDKIAYAVSYDDRYIYKLLADSFPDTIKRLREINPKDKVIVYGAGANLESTILVCENLQLPVSYICDRDIEKQGSLYKGIPIISPECLIREHQQAVIVISTTACLKEVRKFLEGYFPKEKIVPFIDEKQFAQMQQQYFDEVVVLKDGEVFVDGGCFDFGTSKVLLNKCKPEKIYAFEPDEGNLEKVRAQIGECAGVEVIPAGLWECNATLHFSEQGSIMSRVDEDGKSEIKAVAIDEVIDGRVTFIKMDIEGSELKALMGAAQKIKKYKPKLAICIYHKPEDLVEIPAYILSLVPEYKFYIRHYSLSAAETVLYAIMP